MRTFLLLAATVMVAMVLAGCGSGGGDEIVPPLAENYISGLRVAAYTQREYVAPGEEIWFDVSA